MCQIESVPSEPSGVISISSSDVPRRASSVYQRVITA
jgi:hypothetical protein